MVGTSKIKRGADVVVSLTGIAALAPVLALLVVVLKLGGGSAVFAHTRLGRNGRLFKCYKFRTMHTDAEHRLSDLLSKDEEAKHEWETHFKLKADPRVTSLGRILRKTSLDELPQLFNVLKGDMSLVGPRPVIEEELRLYGDYASDYLTVRPGITGLWQVSGRNDLDYDERVSLDVTYIRQWTLTLDLRILLKTVFVVFTHRGAY